MSNNWYEQGKPHIWHPYTQMKTAPDPLPVKAAKNCILYLEDGRELVDGIASWWSACHGYNHPHIKAAMEQQLESMSHVMFAGLAHEPAYRLAKKLADITPKGLNHTFFSDSGSTAVEVAMKMAVQYWQNKGQKKRDRFIAFKNGYHGDTMGAMSLCDQESGMHARFSHYMPMQYVINLPISEYGMAEFEEVVESFKNNVAGLIMEPLLQGAGGMKFHSPDILAEIASICKKHDVLLIVDEIATGFGRTGMMFACEEADITPDILCLGKALTGGSCTLGATLTTEEIFEAFLSEKLEDCLMHGPTYMANPLACSAALASLELFEQEPRLQQVQEIETQLWNELASCKEYSKVVDVRVRGAVGVVQLEATWDDIWWMRKELVNQGVWLRPFSNVLYIMPAFTITTKELTVLTQAVKQTLIKWVEAKQ